VGRTASNRTKQPEPPIVIGIAGCSGSGKTTLAQELAHQLNATLFPLDLYYRDLTHIHVHLRHQENFDHPAALEHELITEHVAGLARGATIERPVYDFSTHSRVHGETVTIAPKHYVLVEGIFALHYDALRTHYSYSLYVDAPDELCYQRRLARDVRERGRTPDSVERQYNATALPMAKLYVQPSKQHAHLIVDGSASIDWSVEQVLRQMKTAGLLLAR
jgi:uridine kinase